MTEPLDRLLAAAPTVPASAKLRERIMEAAPRPCRAWRLSLSRLGLGAGLAAACAAGVLAGFIAAPMRHGAQVDPAEDAAMLLREPPDPWEG